MTYLLDTNVVSELRKISAGKADPNVTAWVKTVSSSTFYLSAIVVYELEIGIRQLERREPAQGAVLREWLDHQVLPIFAERILLVDTRVAQLSAKLSVPKLQPFRDGLIAATALVHGMKVVTRNVADFTATGVVVVNPWN